MILRKIIIFFLVTFNALFSQPNAEQELIHLLQKWAQDFNSKNIQASCELFAPDLIACFPGISDENYEQNCSSLRTVLMDKSKTYFYEPPIIESVLVENNLGVVRLVWNLRISDKDHTELNTARSLDIFTRQKDGRWKLSVSFAYPEKISDLQNTRRY